MHAPHWEVSQPIFAPVSPSPSRRKSTSSVRGSTSASRRIPLTAMVTGITFVFPFRAQMRRRRIAGETGPPSLVSGRSYERAGAARKRARRRVSGRGVPGTTGRDADTGAAGRSAKSRMSTAAILFPAIIFGIVVVGVVLYLVLR